MAPPTETPSDASSGHSIWPPVVIQQVSSARSTWNKKFPFKKTALSSAPRKCLSEQMQMHTHKERTELCIFGGETTQLSGHGPLPRLGRRDLFFFSTVDSSIPKTSVRTEGLPGKPTRLNSNPAQPAEMWQVGILQDNQDQGSPWHKQCFETYRQRTLRPRLSAGGVGRYQNCSSFLWII